MKIKAIKKDVGYAIDSIESLGKEKAYKVRLPDYPIDKKLAVSRKNLNGNIEICIYIEEPYKYPYMADWEKFGIYESFILENTNSIYSVGKGNRLNASIVASDPMTIKIEVESFQKGETSTFNDTHLRLVIPCEKKIEFNAFHANPHKINDTTYFNGLIKINLNNSQYHLYKYSNKDKNTNYLIIDSCQPEKLDSFKDITKSILLSYGFVTGNLYQDAYYYQVLSKDKTVLSTNTSYFKQEPSALSSANLFHPMDFKMYLKHFKKEYVLDKISAFLTENYFNKMVSKIHSLPELSHCIKLMIEGNQSNLLLLRGGIYSIALETMTNIICDENEDKLNPISDKKLSKLLIEKFKLILDEYSPFISDYGTKVLNTKIDNINSPTNSKKLLKPFEILGIKLNKEEIKILNQRNKFLHGVSIDSNDEDLKYVTYKFLTLVNILILKYCGYNGHIADYGAMYQLRHQDKVTAHLFRII